ncbi:S8 family serine peptidase [Actinomadura sediminis]|uniref:S8 family serine peptidase n=1 Tax=Actinomadura sediminis TaxID=1038904 RepID=UPI00366B9DDB
MIAGVVTSSPITAYAIEPTPHEAEWWFTTWQVTEKLWPVTMGGGITVAVVDSGVNAALPELRSAVLPGYDATGQGRDAHQDVDRTPDALGKGGFGHGTAMASLIAARGGGAGMVGVAPEAMILPVIARQGTEYATGIRWAADNGAKVINISAAQVNAYSADTCPKPFQEAIDHALRKDVVVIAGSGNAGRVNLPMIPGGCPGVLTVGAVDHRLRPWTDSTRQRSVDVAAPGVDVVELDRQGRLGQGTGTSPATALASAAVALLRAKHPQMPAREVVQRIIATAKDTGPSGWDDRTGYGVVNPYKALTTDVPANAPNPVYAEWDQLQKRQPTTPASPAAQAAAKDESTPVLNTRTLLLIAAGAAALLALVGTSLALLFRRKNTHA